MGKVLIIPRFVCAVLCSFKFHDTQNLLTLRKLKKDIWRELESCGKNSEM